ncbi:MAG: LamG domain-containing protein [Alphaproteobacteria bacterium]|nr:LamG domain-containing protein [Alphaproteobacteria bacterium]
MKASATPMPSNFTVMKLTAQSYAQTSSNIGIALDGTAAFSIAAWAKFNGLGDNSSILSKDGTIWFGSVGDILSIQITGYPPLSSNPNVNGLDDTDWHHVCVTFDGSQAKLYIDGFFNTMANISGTGSTTASPVLIGNGLQGLVSSVTVFNQALDGDTVMSIMYDDPAASSVVACFDFSQNPPVDTGSGHLPISLQQQALMVTSAPALELSGVAFALPIDDWDVNPGGYQVDPYTVQTWVYVSSTASPEQAILVNGDLASDTGIAFYLDYDSTQNKFRICSQRGSYDTGFDLVSNSLIAPETWVNLATVFDGTNLSIYINGVQDVLQPAGPIPLIRDMGEVMIGAASRNSQSTMDMPFQGYIAWIDVWSRALSAAEITTYMNQAPELSAAGIEASYDFATTPPRSLFGTSIGLIDGASVSNQVSIAGLSQSSRKVSFATPPEPLDEKDLARLIQEAQEQTIEKDDAEAFKLAMMQDLAEYGHDPMAREKIEAAWQSALAGLGESGTGHSFRVTDHVLNGERIMLCHTRRGVHVAYRGKLGEFDDCTLWKVRLFFILFAGAIDAVFGVPCTLNQNAITYIAKLITSPRIAALMAERVMGASIVYKIVCSLVDQGIFRQLLGLLTDIGFWTVIRIVSRAILVFAGFGAANIISSLIATAATFMIALSERPTSCNPLPAVTLAAIKFNHDPTGAAVDALSIRKNATTSISVPEWTSGKIQPQESPAAYAKSSVSGSTITIMAKFTINTSDAVQLQIKADGGGILGAIDAVTVNFVNGVSSPQYVTLNLSHHLIATTGISSNDVTWSWSYKRPSDANWTAMASSSHRIYVVLSPPNMPWRQSNNLQETQLPWTDLLDIVTSANWAQGKTTTDDTVNAVTQAVNSKIGLAYDKAQGASVYTGYNYNISLRTFLCTGFIDYVGGGVSPGHIVNCTDCATIVTACANILGCNVFASVMHPSSSGGFSTNKIIAIGDPDTGWAYPFPNPSGTGGGFSYHEVAWTGAGSFTDPLYDACLKVDSGNNPWDWTSSGVTHTPQLPLKMAFTTQGISPALPIATPFTSSSYRERLATNDAGGIGSCVPQGQWPSSQSGRRYVV